MKKILLGIIILFLIVPFGYSQNQPLQLTIKSDKQVYEVGEEIKLEATLKNNSDKEMILFWNNVEPTTQAVISGQTGSVVVSIPNMPINNLERLYIKPNNFVKKTLSVKPELFLKGFRWEISLIYNFPATPLGFELGPNQEIWMKSLTSNTITIEVKEKKEISKEEAIKLVQDYIKEHNISVIDINKPLKISQYSRIKENDSWLIHYEHRREYQADPPPWHVFIVDKKTGEIRKIGLL